MNLTFERVLYVAGLMATWILLLTMAAVSGGAFGSMIGIVMRELGQ